MDGHQEDQNTSCENCPRCKLRQMLTAALTGEDCGRHLELLRRQLLKALRAVRRAESLDYAGAIGMAGIDKGVEGMAGELAIDLAVDELIVVCDRVYQVADGSALTTDTMPAGRYWVGDLCSVLGDVWDDVPFDDGVHTLPDGRRVAKFSTIHGDGIYDDDRGNEYSVDSGSLGCILVADIRDAHAYTEPGAFVTVNASFVPRRTYPAGASPDCDGGVLHLAGVQIQLDADDDDE